MQMRLQKRIWRSVHLCGNSPIAGEGTSGGAGQWTCLRKPLRCVEEVRTQNVQSRCLLRTTEPSKFPLLREEGEKENASEEVLKGHGVRSRANPAPTVPTTPLCTARVCHQQPGGHHPRESVLWKGYKLRKRRQCFSTGLPWPGFQILLCRNLRACDWASGKWDSSDANFKGNSAWESPLDSLAWNRNWWKEGPESQGACYPVICTKERYYRPHTVFFPPWAPSHLSLQHIWWNRFHHSPL